MKRPAMLLAALLSISVAATAQESKPSVPLTQRISVGAAAGISNTIANSSGYPVGLQNDVHAFDAGIFGRIFAGEHFAFQADLSGRFHEKEFMTMQYGTEIDSTRLFTHHRVVHSRAMAWLLQVQYFLLSGKHQLRPYFSAGAGRIVYRYQMTLTDEMPARTYRATQINRSGLFQFAQGLVYNVNAKWQINQSFYYQYENERGSAVGLNLGAAYRLR